MKLFKYLSQSMWHLASAMILATLMCGSFAFASSDAVYVSPVLSLEQGATSLAAHWSFEPDHSHDHGHHHGHHHADGKGHHHNYTHSSELEVRFKNQGIWGEWYVLEPTVEDDYNENHSTFIGTSGFEAYQYRATADDNHDLRELLDTVVFTPIKGAEADVDELSPVELIAALPSDVDRFFAKLSVPKGTPRVISRGQWKADENYRYLADSADRGDFSPPAVSDSFLEKFKSELKIVKRVEETSEGKDLVWPLEYPDKIRKIIIHHTATTREITDPAQVVRDIYHWHAMSKGWGDIGYNYLIDGEGRIYEGRAGGDSVVAGHARLANVGSIGIALLGNFEEKEVPEKAVASLIQLVTHLSHKHNIDADSKSWFRGEFDYNVIGHRDVGSTACPGQNLYEKLPAIRQVVAGKKPVSTVVSSKSSSYVNSGNVSKTYSSTKDRYDYKLAVSTARQVARAGRTIDLNIKLKNTGDATWNRNGGSYVTIRDENNKVIGRLREQTVKPGKTGTFKVAFKAPQKTGEQVIKLAPTVGTRTSMSSGDFDLNVYVYKKTHATELTSLPTQNHFKPGQKVTLPFSFKNTGGIEWKSYGKDRLRLSVRSQRGVSLSRAMVTPEIIQPGETASVKFALTAPEKEGNYVVYLRSFAHGTMLMEQQIKYRFTVSNNPPSQEIKTAPKKDTTSSVVTSVPRNSLENPEPGTVVTSTPKPKSKPAVTTAPTPQPAPEPTPKAASVTSYNDDIRVAISFRGNPIITGNGNFDLYEGDKKLTMLPRNTSARVTLREGRFEVMAGRQAFVLSQVPRFIPHSGTIMKIQNYEHRPAWNRSLNDNSYRGTLEVVNDEGQLVVVNELPLELYLKGIGEVANSQPYEKIKTIMVLARSYAKYYMTLDEKFPGKPYHLKDDPESSQKYLGYGLEVRTPNVVKAVEETEGEVVTYNGVVVKTPYFNQSNGRTLSAKEVWGWTHTPYLQSVDDPYCKGKRQLGHGVGLSGCGATGAAKRGKTYDEIIKYYYQGVAITKQ